MPELTVGEFYEERKAALKLSLLAGQKGLTKRRITVPDIYRPGLALTGYFKFFAHERIQIFGKTELSYLDSLSPKRRGDILKRIFSYPLCCLIVAQGLKPAPLLREWASRRQVPLLLSQLATTRLVADLTIYLEDKLAPQTALHGTLVEVYGLGALILGKSGIGKSECALELLKRGHGLVADDLCHLKRSAEQVIIGWGDELLSHHMEIRGLGIIDIKDLFGVGALRKEAQVEMVLSLEEWVEGKEYDRTGLDDNHYTILDVPLPYLLLPVRPGRSLSNVIEVAAMNQRLKKEGKNSARAFDERVANWMQEKHQIGGKPQRKSRHV
jgi:HPr kinase/phosphorylase